MIGFHRQAFAKESETKNIPLSAWKKLKVADTKFRGARMELVD